MEPLPSMPIIKSLAAGSTCVVVPTVSRLAASGKPRKSVFAPLANVRVVSPGCESGSCSIVGTPCARPQASATPAAYPPVPMTARGVFGAASVLIARHAPTAPTIVRQFRHGA
jgi:hypothetical protein